jgi:hypothetical protein
VARWQDNKADLTDMQTNIARTKDYDEPCAAV